MKPLTPALVPALRFLWWSRLALWLVALYPIAGLAWQLVRDDLGPDPGKAVVDHFGIWAFRLLLLTLAVRPLAEMSRQPVLIRLRRPAGLFCLCYASLHLACSLLYILGWTWTELAIAVVERTYILFGFAAWVLLLALGVTSSNRARRRLGRRWRQLHRAIYGAAILAALHFLGLVRSDFSEPTLYTFILGLLLAYRIWRWRRRTIN